MTENLNGKINFATLWFLFIIFILGCIVRIPNINRDMTGMHAWKNIRHYQFAQGMLETGDLLTGRANYTQPETSEKWISVTEAPFADWTQVLVYKIFNQSILSFNLTFIFINLLSIILFFCAFKKHLRSPLTLFGCLLFTLVPLNIYFSNYGIGEQFIFSGQIFLVSASANLLRKGTNIKSYILFMFACLFLALCKLTTGLMTAALSFIFVNLALAEINKETLIPLFNKHKKATIITITLFTIVFSLFLITYWTTLAKVWPMEPEFLNSIFYTTLLKRWKDLVGLHFLIGSIFSLFFYILFTKATKPAKKFSSFEKAVMCLLAANTIQTFVQSRAFIAHEYYSLTWIIPLILLNLCFLKRVIQGKKITLTCIAFLIFCSIHAYTIPKQIDLIRFLNNVKNLPRHDQKALNAFFSERKTAREKYFIISKTPVAGYFADVNILLLYYWESVLNKITNNTQNIDKLKKLGIEYVVYPTYAIPQKVKDALKQSPLFDPGPKHLKLGLTHRGDNFYIFKITHGIESQTPLKGKTMWRTSSQNISTSKDETLISFVANKKGNIICDPFKTPGDALVYKASGINLRQTRLELSSAGELKYTQYPHGTTVPEFFALDIRGKNTHDISINIINTGSTHATKSEITSLGIITYTDVY